MRRRQAAGLSPKSRTGSVELSHRARELRSAPGQQQRTARSRVLDAYSLNQCFGYRAAPTSALRKSQTVFRATGAIQPEVAARGLYVPALRRRLLRPAHDANTPASNKVSVSPPRGSRTPSVAAWPWSAASSPLRSSRSIRFARARLLPAMQRARSDGCEASLQGLPASREPRRLPASQRPFRSPTTPASADLP